MKTPAPRSPNLGERVTSAVTHSPVLPSLVVAVLVDALDNASPHTLYAVVIQGGDDEDEKDESDAPGLEGIWGAVQITVMPNPDLFRF